MSERPIEHGHAVFEERKESKTAHETVRYADERVGGILRSVDSFFFPGAAA